MFLIDTAEFPSALTVTLLAAFALLALALALSFIRLVKGPTLPDRVVAFDTMATISVGILIVFAIFTDQPLFLDVALVMTLIYFLGTVAFAYFIEQSLKR